MEGTGWVRSFLLNVQVQWGLCRFQGLVGDGLGGNNSELLPWVSCMLSTGVVKFHRD